MSQSKEIPLVSISCITYNHAPFIGQALESMLAQKTNFAFEILIHDDASTDGTEEIIREYEKKYPHIIKPLYEKENQWQKGRVGSVVFNFPRARGKYVALCEGDDYWIDVDKLQKQVDFLENDQKYSFCFTPRVVVDKHNKKIKNPPSQVLLNSQPFAFHQFLKKNFVSTATILFRKNLLGEDYPLVCEKSPISDWVLVLYLSNQKPGYRLKDVTAAYRVHNTNIFFNEDKLKKERWALEALIAFWLYTDGIKQKKELKQSLLAKMAEIKSICKKENQRISFCKYSFKYFKFKFFNLI